VKLSKGDTGKPMPTKVILANTIDAIVESAHRVTEMLNETQSRLEV